MVKDHSDSERENMLLPHRLLFQISSKVLLYASSHRQDSTFWGLCYTSWGGGGGGGVDIYRQIYTRKKKHMNKK